MFLSSNTHITLSEHPDDFFARHTDFAVKDIVKSIRPGSQTRVKFGQSCCPYISSFS